MTYGYIALQTLLLSVMNKRCRLQNLAWKLTRGKASICVNAVALVCATHCDSPRLEAQELHLMQSKILHGQHREVTVLNFKYRPSSSMKTEISDSQHCRFACDACLPCMHAVNQQVMTNKKSKFFKEHYAVSHTSYRRYSPKAVWIWAGDSIRMSIKRPGVFSHW